MNRTPNLRTLLATGLLSLGFASASVADNHVSELRWEREGADYSSYTGFYLPKLRLDSTAVIKPAWEQDDDSDWSFESGADTEIQALFKRIMTEELTYGDKYQVVDEAGPGILRLEVELLSITPFVKPGTKVDSDTGFEISTLGSGDLHVSAEMRDGTTREVLLLVEGERPIGTEYKELSVENHMANLEETFRDWGQKIREYVMIKQSH